MTWQVSLEDASDEVTATCGRSEGDEGGSGGCGWFSRYCHFFLVPKVKFLVFLVCHMLYTALLLAFLFLDPALASHGHQSNTLLVFDGFEWRLWLEPAFWFWTLGRIVDEATDIVSWDAEGLRAYWRSNWNKVDVTTNVLAIACVGVRVGCVLGGDEPLPTADHASNMAYDDGWTSAGALRSDIVVGVGLCATDHAWSLLLVARNLYALMVLLLFIRIFDFLTTSESLGVLCIVLYNIFLNDVTVFLLLTSIILVGFSLCFWLLLAGAIANSDDPLANYGGATNQPFMMSLWGLLGNTYDTSPREPTGAPTGAHLTTPWDPSHTSPP